MPINIGAWTLSVIGKLGAAAGYIRPSVEQLVLVTLLLVTLFG